MATTLMPLDPATTPQSAQRLLPIAAKLLPPEILNARRAKLVRARVIAALVAAVVLLGGWYAFATYQVSEAKALLDEAVAEQVALTAEQKNYNPVVQTQASSKSISERLSILLADDLRWAGLLSTLRSNASAAGVTVTGVSGTLASSTGGATGAASQNALPGVTTTAVVGTVTITGVGGNKAEVAQFVDRLGDVALLTNVYLTNVTADDKEVQFSVQGDVTREALGGRFTTTNKGGK